MSRTINEELNNADVQNQDEFYMRQALSMAKRSAKRDEVPVGAVLVRDGVVLARAGNTRENAHDPCGHAEINALRRAARKLGGWNLHHCTLYVTLEPCPMCAGACVNARIERIVFGAADQKAGACGTVMDITKGLNHSPKVTKGVLEQQSVELLQQFFKQKRQKKG